MQKRNLVKISLLLIVAALFLFFMYRIDILDFKLLFSSFQKHKNLILLIGLLQVANCFFMAFRYQYLLRIFRIQVGFFNGLSATVVSNSIGLWMPGSMAFIEVIRIGLMLGANHHIHLMGKNKNNSFGKGEQFKSEIRMRSRLAAVSLFDRLIGLFVMLLFGGLSSCYAILFEHQTMSFHPVQWWSLIAIIVFSFSCALLILILPLLAQSVFFRKIISRIERLFLILFRKGMLNRLLQKVFQEVASILDAMAIGREQMSHFLIPFLLSCCCFVLMSLGTYFSALAISSSIPFLAIFGTLSLLSLASLLPIGIAGMGGIQLFAVVVMSIFGVEPKTAASAQFLQNAINLLSVSALGFFFLKFTIRQIHAMIKSGR